MSTECYVLDELVNMNDPISLRKRARLRRMAAKHFPGNAGMRFWESELSVEKAMWVRWVALAVGVVGLFAFARVVSWFGKPKLGWGVFLIIIMIIMILFLCSETSRLLVMRGRKKFLGTLGTGFAVDANSQSYCRESIVLSKVLAKCYCVPEDIVLHNLSLGKLLDNLDPFSSGVTVYEVVEMYNRVALGQGLRSFAWEDAAVLKMLAMN